jgi:hypothetical protein
MTMYIVTVKEIHGQQFTVEADSFEEAIAMVKEGDGDIGHMEYILTMDTDTWDVYDADADEVVY